MHGYKTAVKVSPYQFATEWGTVGNYTQCVCDNITINCDKSAKAANLLRLHTETFTSQVMITEEY